MKKFIFALLLVVVISGLATAARSEITDGNAERFRIIVLGLENHDDYDYIFDGITKFYGVSDLTLSRTSSGTAVFTGYISNEEDMFTNDVQGLVSDRFSYKDRESGGVLEITLTKL